MKTWPGGLLTCLLGGLPARLSSASGRCEFINVTNHRRSSIHLLRSDWSISHPLPLANPDLNHSMLTTSFPYGNRHGKNRKPFVILPNRGWSVSNAKMVWLTIFHIFWNIIQNPSSECHMNTNAIDRPPHVRAAFGHSDFTRPTIHFQSLRPTAD